MLVAQGLFQQALQQAQAGVAFTAHAKPQARRMPAAASTGVDIYDQICLWVLARAISAL